MRRGILLPIRKLEVTLPRVKLLGKEIEREEEGTTAGWIIPKSVKKREKR